MGDIARLLDTLLVQHLDMGEVCDEWEVVYLREEAEKGLAALGKACHVVFGTRLNDLLYGALQYAQECNQHTYNYMTDSLTEHEARRAIKLSRELALSCMYIQEIQREYDCGGVSHSEALAKSAAHYAELIKNKLDPQGILFVDAIDSPPDL